MTHSSNSTDQLVAQAKLGEQSAFTDLIGHVGPRLRRAMQAELEAVHHDLDAAKMWDEIQEEARERVSEFQGSTEAEFEAWAERLVLRHIRNAVRAGPGNIDTVVGTANTLPPAKPAAAADPQAGGEPSDDPNATIAPGDNATVSADPFATFAKDPHGTITNPDFIPPAPQTTRIFGDYEILETIARGGMGVVYKARQHKLNRIVALKMILAGQFADQSDIDRFYAEAEAAAQLRHPNIVGIHEVGQCEEQHYFSMEYIEGKSLGDLVREHPLAPRSAAKFVKTISEAMQYAHQEGVLHRDLKPSNVLVDENDVPLITDFGLAKRAEGQSQLTVAGTVLGTPSYMPPEQASGKLDQISVRSDVYSLGAILYELITGKPPFGAANPWETIKQVLGTEPVSPRLLNNSVPVDLETICLKCLQKDAERRYASAQELADELGRFLSGEPILARPIGVVERTARWCYRNPWPTVALAVMLLGVVGTSVGLVQARVAQHRAEMSRDQLLAAINEMFTAWSDVTLLNEPGFEDVRAQLLATASSLYRKMGEQLGDDPKIQHELGVSYFRLGKMMYHLRSYDDARKSLEAGLEIQRQLHAARPKDEARLHALGESQNLTGKLLEVTAASVEQLEQAEAVYKEAIDAREKLVRAFPDKFEYERELLNARMNQGMVWQRMADLFVEDEQPERAAVLDTEALARAEEVQRARVALRDRLDVGSDVRHEVVQDLALGYFNMANVSWWQGKYKTTSTHVASAVQAFDELLEPDPGHLQYQYDLAYCLALGGDAQTEQLRLLTAEQSEEKRVLYREALLAYERAREIFERLANKSPIVPKYRRAVADVYRRLGDLHFLAEHDQQSLDAFQSAVDILKPLAAEYPEYPAYQQLLNEAYGGIELVKQYSSKEVE